MPKRGQHQGDSDDKDVSKGPNNPSKSVNMSPGTPKKQETYHAQAAHHEATDSGAQHSNNEWDSDTRDKPSIENSPRARDSDIGSGRSGSDSNAGKSSRG